MPQLHPGLIIAEHMEFESEPLLSKDPQPVMEAGSRILSELQVHYWVSAGTALGLLRDGDFIPHDTDIDVEVMLSWDEASENESLANEILSRFESTGFALVREMVVESRAHPMQMAFVHRASNVVFDIYFFYTGIRLGELLNYNDAGTLTQPERFFLNLESHQFAEFDYPFPAPKEDYFAMRYGVDWAIPRKKKTGWSDDAANLADYGGLAPEDGIDPRDALVGVSVQVPLASG